MPHTAIDHVIAVVSDMQSAAKELEQVHGLASIAGGRHPGHGTGNRIVPLGSSYLELMAVVDPGEAAASPLGRWALAHASPGIVPAALCLSTDDIAPIARMLGEEPLAMSRRTPEGGELAWRLAGLTGMLDSGYPFFIEWNCRPEDHPAAADAPHRVTPTGIASVEIGSPPGPLAELAGATPSVRLASEPGVRSVVIGTAQGPVTL